MAPRRRMPIARPRRRKDALTFWHQIATLGGIPAAIALAGWLAFTANSMQLDNAIIKTQLIEHGKQLERIWEILSGTMRHDH